MEKNKLIIALWGACLLGSGAYAQEQIPARGYSLIVESAQNRLLESDRAGSLKIPVFGQGFQATCDASWLTLTTEKNQLRLDYTANEEAGQRSATITLRNAANQTASLTVVQPGFRLWKTSSPSGSGFFPPAAAPTNASREQMSTKRRMRTTERFITATGRRVFLKPTRPY